MPIIRPVQITDPGPSHVFSKYHDFAHFGGFQMSTEIHIFCMKSQFLYEAKGPNQEPIVSHLLVITKGTLNRALRKVLRAILIAGFF